MDTKCIYRRLHSLGVRCKRNRTDSASYCKYHLISSNFIFDMMYECIIPGVSNYEQVQHIFHFVQNDENYGQYLNPNIVDKKMYLFLIMLDYLYCKRHISYILLTNMGKKNILKNMNKKKIINHIYGIMLKTKTMSDEDVNKIIKIQHIFRKNLLKKITKFNNETSENAQDPFTFDELNEIPKNELFSYKDEKGHIYSFSAIELDFFIKTQAEWNPFTREPFPNYLIHWLNIFIQYNQLKKKNSDEICWLSPTHAYTEVSQLFEKMGFYNNVVWFYPLTFGICEKIITIYRDVTCNLNREYFPVSFTLNRETFVYDFCKEIIRLFQDGNDHFILCCHFVKSLALYLDGFYHNLPNWLSNIESPIQPINNPFSDTLLLIYVQNMLDDMVME